MIHPSLEAAMDISPKNLDAVIKILKDEGHAPYGIPKVAEVPVQHVYNKLLRGDCSTLIHKVLAASDGAVFHVTHSGIDMEGTRYNNTHHLAVKRDVLERSGARHDSYGGKVRIDIGE